MGIDYEALLICGWSISYDEAVAIYTHLNWSQDIAQFYIKEFRITDGWYVKSYADSYRKDDERRCYYIVYKEWERSPYRGLLVSEIVLPSDEEMMRLLSVLSKVKVRMDDMSTKPLNSISQVNLRIYTQIYVHRPEN